MGLLLPDGGVHSGEDTLAAASHKLTEETSLVATWAWPLLRHESAGIAQVVFAAAKPARALCDARNGGLR